MILIENNGKAQKDNFDIVKEWFESFGYSVLEKPAIQDNDCDMYVVGKKRVLRVEIKAVRELQTGVWQAANITEPQRGCDACALVFPSGAVFVEKMTEYLKSCSAEGYRSFTWLKL